ncbi:MAG: tetratricopeptide repeat protein [Lachnospiraceae bacterium]|nr:tetratricopeptide repeat protein [Lachnospiraceae bacterium]
MKKIEENRSLFYNLLDFARMFGGNKGGSVEDMFNGPGTELDAICQEYVEKSKKDEWKVSGEITIHARSTFGRYRKQIREYPASVPGRVAGNYENILNALLWKNSYLPIENSRNITTREVNTTILRNKLKGVFEETLGFSGKDEELIYSLCEGNIASYIQKISHIALYPDEIRLIRKTVEHSAAGDFVRDDRVDYKVITILLSIEDTDRRFKLGKNIKQLESSFSRAMSRDVLRLPVISFTDRKKNEDQLVKKVIKSSSRVFLIADSFSNSGMNMLIKYTSDFLENFDSKPVIFVNATGEGKTTPELFLGSSCIEYQVRDYTKDAEIMFEIARVFLSSEIKGKPKAEMRSETLLLNGIPAIDLSDHPMFSTDTLLTLRKEYARLNEQYDCIIIENMGDASALAELDSRRGAIATRIRQCENIICDCQMSAIGIEQTGSILDDLNAQIESCVNSGKYEDAVVLLNKREWGEEFNSAVTHKAKADEVIKAYIKSRRYLIASKRVLDENKKTEPIAEIYEELRKVAGGTNEYESILYEYLTFLNDTGKYEEAGKLIQEEESDHKERGQDIRNYRFLYAAGEMYFKTGNSTQAEAYFKRAASYVLPDDRLDYIEMNVGIAKCMWMGKRYTLMRQILVDTEKYVSQEDLQSPRGKRVVSALYRYLAIYENNCFNIPKALKHAEKALDIYIPLYETKQSDHIQELEDKIGYARILNNIAVLYQRTGNNEKAADMERKALEIYRICARSNPALALTELTKACRNYSVILRKQRQYNAAESIMSEAMSILEEFKYTTDKAKRQKISCLTEMGNINLALERYNEAEKYFDQASLWLEKIKNGDVFMYDVYNAENKYNYGRLYRRLGKYDKSEEYLLKAVDIWNNYAQESTGNYTVLLAQAYAELELAVKKNKKKSEKYCRMSEEQINKFSASARKFARKKVEVSLLS